MKLLVFIAISWLLALSCARPATQKERAPIREEIIVEAIENSGGKHLYPVRYNPPLCPCPEFEVQVDRLWVRILLVDYDEDQPVSRQLRRFVQENPSGDEAKPLFLIGSLDPDRIEYTATGFPVVEFVVEGFTDTFPATKGQSGRQNKE